MKLVGLTQRVAVEAKHGERRDCLDQRWAVFVERLGFVPVALPNIAPHHVPALLDVLRLDAVILTGGNSLHVVEPAAPGAAPERDAFEAMLVDEAVRRSIPMLGVCRGMQLINLHLGGQLSRLAGHVACDHLVMVETPYSSASASASASVRVNSYHNWGIRADQLAASLIPIARDRQGNIEGFVHESARLSGIMWHPERNLPPKPEDLHVASLLL